MHEIRYYRVLQLFGLDVIQLEDTPELLSREAFEALKRENRDVDYLMR